MKYLLHHSLEASAKNFPNKVAFKDSKSSITYKELDIKTNCLANYLLSLGVKKGDRIGIYLDRCAENAIAIYGILKAGACFVPLNTTDPVNKIETIIDDCSIKYLITKSKPIGKIKAIGDTLHEKLKGIIGLEQNNLKVESYSWEHVFNLSNRNPNQLILNEDLAYIMYTSGTTGTPKGIMHTHRSGLDYARFSAELYNVTPKDIFASHSALYYDISTFAYFTIPYIGATTVIASEAEVKMPVSLSQLIEREAITIWYSVPLALTQMLTAGLLEKRNLTSLRWVLFGGEVFPIEKLNELIGLLPNTMFSNVYGPAEVNQCTVYNFRNLADINSTLPLGAPSLNAEILIIDKNENILQVNEIGELIVRSSTMMLGYWNKPELTQSKFFTQFENGINKLFYKTGDLAKIDEKGQLIFYGRKDRQVKIRGYRVELSEVEVQIKNIINSNEIAVVKTKNNNLHAYIEGESKLSENDIKRKLIKQISPYALPERITFIPEIPRTQAGKVDYNNLIQQS